jgi:hypothetical protein
LGQGEIERVKEKDFCKKEADLISCESVGNASID